MSSDLRSKCSRPPAESNLGHIRISPIQKSTGSRCFPDSCTRRSGAMSFRPGDCWTFDPSPPAVLDSCTQRGGDLCELLHAPLHRRLPVVHFRMHTGTLRPRDRDFSAARSGTKHAAASGIPSDRAFHLAGGKYKHLFRCLAIPESDRRMGRRPSWEMEFLPAIGHHDLYHRRESKAHQEPHPRTAVVGRGRFAI